MGALEREVMFLSVCATTATVRRPLTQHRGGNILKKMALSERLRTCSAPVQIRYIKNGRRRVKLKLWRFVEFVIKVGLL
jgi:hypothetical protein